MTKLRVGLIGCGGIGGTHAPHYGNHPDAELCAVCDSDIKLAEHAAKEFNVPYFTDYQEMLRCVALDVVDICTPPNSHRDMAIACFNQGIHVICEKPLAISTHEAQEMISTAQEKRLLLMTAFCHRFHPPILYIKQAIDEGKLGQIAMFRNRFGGRNRGFSKSWRSIPEISGGGVLTDNGVHSIDLFRFLVGEVVRAKSFTHAIEPGLAAEDIGAMLVESTDGAIGVIESSFATPHCGNVVEIYGTEGTANYNYDTGQLRIYSKDSTHWEEPKTPQTDRFRNEIDHFLQAVRGNVPLAVTGEDGLRALEILTEAQH